MSKKLLPLLILPLLFGGCTAMFTNLTPKQQLRNPNNLYPVEVSFRSRQQTLRWQSIKPTIVVGSESIPMHATPLMTNRWEGLVPVPSGEGLIHYHYRFDFENTSFGSPTPDSAVSPEYTLRVVGN